MSARTVLAAMTGTLVLAGGAAAAPARPGGDPLPARPLATAWPAHVDCPAFERVDVAVDDRVEAVTWRGPGAAERTFAVARPADPRAAWQGFRLRSWSLDGIGVMASSRIVHAESKEDPSYGFRAARATQLARACAGSATPRRACHAHFATTQAAKRRRRGGAPA